MLAAALGVVEGWRSGGVLEISDIFGSPGWVAVLPLSGLGTVLDLLVRPDECESGEILTCLALARGCCGSCSLLGGPTFFSSFFRDS
jgi:hypothetical protein